MESIIEKERSNRLFDYYEGLLTDKQKTYFKMYYFEDYSLGEIANEFSLSRNAVFDNIKKTVKILEKYEEILHLMENGKKRDEIINELMDKYHDDLLDELKKID